jgi:hypothetical protein
VTLLASRGDGTGRINSSHNINNIRQFVRNGIILAGNTRTDNDICHQNEGFSTHLQSAYYAGVSAAACQATPNNTVNAAIPVTCRFTG